MNHRYSLVIVNEVAEIERLATFLTASGQEMGLSDDEVMSINLCAEEAVSNVIFYAYPVDEIGEVEITFELTDNTIVLEISDKGCPFDPTARPDADTTLSAQDRQIGGLGIYLYKQIMQKVEYHRNGERNVLRMEKRVG